MKDLFEEYLDREKSEFSDNLDDNLRSGNWNMDESTVEQLKQGIYDRDESKRPKDPTLSSEKPTVEENPAFTDLDVMNHFGILERAWNSMVEGGRQALRDSYSRRK